MRRTVLVCLGGIALLLAGLGGCSNTKSQQIPNPDPMPQGAGFEGVWYSPQYKHMYLTQSGNQVRGVYTYQTGGRLTGKVEGNLLKFKWQDPGEKEKAQRTMEGHGYLKLVKEEGEKKLKGEWGYGEKFKGAGPWTAEYIRPMKSSDPRKIDEIEDSNEPTPP